MVLLALRLSIRGWSYSEYIQINFALNKLAKIIKTNEPLNFIYNRLNLTRFLFITMNGLDNQILSMIEDKYSLNINDDPSTVFDEEAQTYSTSLCVRYDDLHISTKNDAFDNAYPNSTFYYKSSEHHNPFKDYTITITTLWLIKTFKAVTHRALRKMCPYYKIVSNQSLTNMASVPFIYETKQYNDNKKDIHLKIRCALDILCNDIEHNIERI